MEEKMLNELVPLLKNYLELSDRDREHQLEIIKELKETTSAMRDCNVTMKLQIKQLETHYEMFSVACKERKGDCLKQFAQIQSAIKSIPSEETRNNMNVRLEAVIVKMDTLSGTVNKMIIRVYSVLGAGAIIFSFFQWFLPFIKKVL
jgi:hypothetical protein